MSVLLEKIIISYHDVRKTHSIRFIGVIVDKNLEKMSNITKIKQQYDLSCP